MFDLSEADLAVRILGCGDGPASFNAQATRAGRDVTSVDPIYDFRRTQIRERISVTFDEILEQTRQYADEFVWTSVGSVEELGQLRLAAMETFLEDYDRGP